MTLLESVGLLVDKLGRVLLSAGSTFSLTSLACAVAVAVAYVVLARRRRNRRVRLRTVWRALFPRRITGSASHSVDVGYFFLSTFVFGLILAWAMLSYQVVGTTVIGQLERAFGPPAPSAWPEPLPRVAITVALFLAYELAYWGDHWLSHRVPFLWEFHKVHHEATVLTPLTMFRIHPVDGLVHANITALVMGAVNGGMNYLLGETAPPYAIADTNLILVLFVHAYVHLQHSHLWIPFRGVFGRVLLSPAHHQIHHSTDPAHFNKNLGSCLAVWDWLFGTLHVPPREPPPLRFGVDDPPGARRSPAEVQSLARGLVMPFLRAFGRLTSAAAHVLPATRGRAGEPGR